MHGKAIQIVSFDNPYPPNFGGVIDVFYKIKALSQLGVKVYLHAYYDDRTDVSGLKPYCESITFYKRNKSFIKFISILPYAANTRLSKDLVFNLKKQNAPILFETIKTTGILKNNVFRNKVAVRCHNIEHNYSWGLGYSETNLIQKIAFFIEGLKFKRFEPILEKADVLFSLSIDEFEYYSANFKNESVFLPVFQGNTEVLGEDGFGKYALYHGDLTTSDNVKSALFIINVFKELSHPLIIASSVSNKMLVKEVSNYKNISFQLIDAGDDLDVLIKNAHVNTLFSYQKSGTKLKVFNALFKGKHCIVNNKMIDEISVLRLCEVAESKAQYKDVVNKIFKIPYTKTENRISVLKNYNASIVVRELVSTLF